MAALNYHHLRYFRAIARERSLTRAAQLLHVSQSALSIQLRQLEERLGHPLFERQGKRRLLTEAGRIALDYADVVFQAGEELMSTLQGRVGGSRRAVRIGAIPTLSRNFQLGFLRPLIARTDVELVLRSGAMRELLTQLAAHELDLVLSNRPALRDAVSPWRSHLLDQQPISLVSRPDPDAPPFRFPEDLHDRPLLLPSPDGDLRAEFDQILERAGVRPIILAEVDDMAMLRLLARDSGAMALAPPIVVRDELSAGVLVERCRVPDLHERFYAIGQSRRFPNPLVEGLLADWRGGDAGA